MSSNKRRKKRMSKGKKWGIIFGIEILAIIILVPVIYVMVQLGRIKTATKDQVNLDNISVNDMDSDVLAEIKEGYRNIVLYGVDARDGSLDKGNRSDSIIIVSINNKTKDVKLCSVYRDTLFSIPDHGFDKVTHAYSYGGAELSMSVLNTNLDLSITEFVTVNFDVLAKVIDALGGLELTLESDAEVEQINLCILEQNAVTGSDSEGFSGPGTYTMDGTQATGYARIRKTEGGDFRRAERQREVLDKMLAKAKSANILTLTKIINEVMPDIYTNLSTADILSIAKDVLSYNIIDQTGYPFNVTTGYYNKLDCVSSTDTLEEEVIQLHQYLFGSEAYSPSSKLIELSNSRPWLN